MEKRIAAYEKKLYRSRLVPHGGALFGHDDGKAIRWSRESDSIPVLAECLKRLSGQTILLAPLAEPYAAIVEYLAMDAAGTVFPDDSETRAFLHDLPVADGFSAEAIAGGLENRKSVLIRGRGIAAIGKTGPSDAYTAFSAACFACFVKFFRDFLKDARQGRLTRRQQKTYETAAAHLPPSPVFSGGLAAGPFKTPEEARAALIEAGCRMVSLGLVDACFGNISYRIDDTLYISTAGSFLDELENDITACPMEDPKCTGARPSSEYPAHLEILKKSGFKGVLHGHPLFSVIMSMDCTIECTHPGECHRTCPHERFVCDVPIVPGETGGGPFGLYTTVPGVIQIVGGAIVYGHGVFTTAKTNFNEALARMIDIEKACRKAYFMQVERHRQKHFRRCDDGGDNHPPTRRGK